MQRDKYEFKTMITFLFLIAEQIQTQFWNPLEKANNRYFHWISRTFIIFPSNRPRDLFTVNYRFLSNKMVLDAGSDFQLRRTLFLIQTYLERICNFYSESRKTAHFRSANHSELFLWGKKMWGIVFLLSFSLFFLFICTLDLWPWSPVRKDA